MKTAVSEDLKMLRFAGEKCYVSCGGQHYAFARRFHENGYVPLGLSSYLWSQGKYLGEDFLSPQIIMELENTEQFVFRNMDERFLERPGKIINSLNSVIVKCPVGIELLIRDGAAEYFALSRKAIGKSGLLGEDFVQWWVSKDW